MEAVHPFISIRITQRLQKTVRVLGLLFKITYPPGCALDSLGSSTVAARSPPTSIFLALACPPPHCCDAFKQEVAYLETVEHKDDLPPDQKHLFCSQ